MTKHFFTASQPFFIIYLIKKRQKSTSVISNITSEIIAIHTALAPRSATVLKCLPWDGAKCLHAMNNYYRYLQDVCP